MTVRVETKARARALQLLYAAEAHGDEVGDMVPGLARLTGPEPTILASAERLAAGVTEQREELDRLVQSAAVNWRLERLAAIDRNILRIGAYEIRAGEVPPLVAIDQALWLAHRFGTPQSPGFINGVLDRLAHDLGRL